MIFSQHALERMHQRGISPDIVQLAVLMPDELEQSYSERQVATKFINGKYLRVVYKEIDGESLVITVYWIEESL